MFASDPPGARVWVDGEDSGFVTPCNMGLSREDHQIDLLLPGYQAASIKIGPRGERWLIHWSEAYISWNTWRFPLFLNYEDGLAPIKLSRGHSPQRIHVPLNLAALE